MKRIVAAALVITLAAPGAFAQEGREELREGMDLLSQGTRLLLQGLMKEMEPALRDLEGVIEDLNAYHPPEFLPNGDIIIRRKQPLAEPLPDTGGEIEL